jgi:phage shock protein A
MGSVASSLGDIGGAIFEPVKQIGNIASDVVREVGHAAESVGREAGKIGQAAVNDPIGTIAKVAAVATQQYWALPLISAADVVAHGGNLEQAALAAGISYAGGAIAAGVGDYLGAGSTATVEMMSQDAASMANQGLTASQIADTLQQSYGVSSDIATQTAAQSVLGTPASEIASNITSQMATQNMLANAAGNTAGGAARAALSGGDINQVLMGGLTSGTGSLAGGYTTQELKDLGLNSTLANAIGKATGAATATTVAGKDAKLSFINSLINTTLAEGGGQVNSGLKSLWNDVNTTASTYNEQLAKAQEDYKTTLTPLEQEAKAAQEVAAKAFDEYKPIRDQFNDLVKQYDEAKAAGDTEKANGLADQANALIPQLNDATTKYNDTVATFDQKLASYTTAADQYKTQIDSLDTLKTDFQTKAADLGKATEEFTQTAVKVADMGDNAKTAFEKLYNSGTPLEDAYKTVSSLNELKDPAQAAFLRQYEENKDPTTSLDFANKVNGLGSNELSAYSNAVKTGLDDTSAFQLAPNMTGLSSYGQNAYLDALRNGADEQTATMTATFAELMGERNDTTPETTDQQTAATTQPAAPTDQQTSGSGFNWNLFSKPAGFSMPSTGTAKTATRWSLPATAPTTAAAAPLLGAAAAATPFLGGSNPTTDTTNQNNTFSGIQNLTPGLTQKMDYTLSGMPNIEETTSPIPTFSTGSTVQTTNYDPFNTGVGGVSDKLLTAGLTKPQLNYVLTGLPGASIQARAEGGSIEEHNPTFFSEGGLESIDNRYVKGEGDGTSDSVAAMLANGEFVIPADVVSKIGNGSNEAGAGVLDQFLVEIRKHAQSNGTKLPPESKGPLAYLLDAKRKVKA